jgi:histidinol-phosphate phosphatase family protein
LGTRRCVFLDRDGVINCKAAPDDYIKTVEEFRLIPQIVDWIRLFNALDFLVIVVTNQRGIARGLMSDADVREIHERMREELLSGGARIDDVYYCPHEENSCECRKPKPGLILAAAAKWDIDVSRSVLIGDSERDRELAAHCGFPFVHVRDGHVVEVVRAAGR